MWRGGNDYDDDDMRALVLLALGCDLEVDRPARLFHCSDTLRRPRGGCSDTGVIRLLDPTADQPHWGRGSWRLTRRRRDDDRAQRGDRRPRGLLHDGRWPRDACGRECIATDALASSTNVSAVWISCRLKGAQRRTEGSRVLRPSTWRRWPRAGTGYEALENGGKVSQDRLASAKRDIEDNATTRGVIDVQRGLRGGPERIYRGDRDHKAMAILFRSQLDTRRT